jgi:hypothetical protein
MRPVAYSARGDASQQSRTMAKGERLPHHGSNMPLRPRALHACTVLLCAFALACAEDKAPPPGSGRNRTQDGGDDGGTGRPARDAGSPRPMGAAVLPPADDEIVLAFGAPAERYSLEVDAEPGVLDVQLSIDTTSSISAEIDTLQQDLHEHVVMRLRERVADASFGVSQFEDFPIFPFGSAGSNNSRPDTPFRLLTPITSDSARVTNAVAGLDKPLGRGGDIPESGAEALWQIATGAGYEHDGETIIEPWSGRAAPGGGNGGGVGFREGALRVVLHVTDAASHSPFDYGSAFPGTHGLEEAAEALHAINAKVIGIVSDACLCDNPPYLAARHELESLALATRAVSASNDDGKCPYGLNGALLDSVDGECPLVFDVSDEGEGLSSTVVDAIVELVDGVRFERVSGRAGDDPLGFVERIVPREVKQDDPPEIADLLPEGEPDGEPDTFVHASGRAKLRFDVELRNTRIAPLDVDQRYRAVVEVVGDGLILVQRTLRIRIPAATAIAPPRTPRDGGTPEPDEADAGG